MENNNYSKKNILSSLFWKLMERGGTQGIQFLIQIILTRLLAPEQFGTIAIVTVFTSLARIFVEGGLNTALIQKQDADEVDFSSVFHLSFGVSVILYIIIYFSSPIIANIYDDPILIPVLRVMSLTLFIGSFKSIQYAYVSKFMMFRQLFKSSLGAIIFSGILGIIVAYSGFGVWALVIQHLVNQFIIVIILFIVVDWRPKLMFSFSRIKELFSFGGRLLFSNILNVLYIDLRTLIIGWIYPPSVLGYYNRGEQIPKFLVSNMNSTIQSVMLPTMSAYQDDISRVKNVVRRAIISSSFLVFPMMVGMFVVAEPLVTVVLTETWLPSVPYLQIFALSYSLMPIHTANLQAINALGRSDIFLRLEIVKKTIGIIILVFSIPFGVYAIALGMLINNIISSFINAYPNKSLLDYSYFEQIKDMLPSLTISIIMGAIVYSTRFIGMPALLLLVIQIILGIVVYIGLAKIFKLDAFTYLLQTFSYLISSNKK